MFIDPIFYCRIISFVIDKIEISETPVSNIIQLAFYRINCEVLFLQACIFGPVFVTFFNNS